MSTEASRQAEAAAAKIDFECYLRRWAADIRKYNGNAYDADQCDIVADEIARLRSANAKMREALKHIAKRVEIREGGRDLTAIQNDYAAIRDEISSILELPCLTSLT